MEKAIQVEVQADGTAMIAGICHRVIGRRGKHVRGRKLLAVQDAAPHHFILFSREATWGHYVGIACDEAGCDIDMLHFELMGKMNWPALLPACFDTRKQEVA